MNVDRPSQENRLYAMLSQVNQAIVRAQSREELLLAICRIAVEHGEFKAAWIGWLDPATHTVRSAAQWGDEHSTLRRVTESADNQSEGCGPTGTAIREGKTCVCNDLVNDDRLVPWHEVAASFGVRAVAGVPIHFQGEICGALGVSATEPDFFQAKEINLLEEMGRIISFALENLEREAKHRRAEEALRESEERYRRLIEVCPDAIFVHCEGRITYVNSAGLKLHGVLQPEEVIGKPMLELVHPDWRDLVRERLDTMQEDCGPVPTIAEQFLRVDGTAVDVEVAATGFALDGKPAVLVIARDITERKQAEQARIELEGQLRQAQKLEAIGTLAGGIAHDFNNILGAMICYTELARRASRNDPGIQEDLAYVLQACERAKNLVRQILSFSRQTNQERRPLDLRLVAKEALKLLRSTLPATIEMGCHMADDLPQVLADPTQIHQVLVNLCTNAAHAMQGQIGRIAVSLERFQVNDELAGSHPDLRPGSYVRLIVSDTGQGMDEATRKRIFEPFFTTKGPGEGTGLGLSVVHGIVRDHEGAICVYSQPSKGTTCHLYFPALATTQDEPQAPRSRLVRGHGERVLVVDDEPALCFALERMLSSLGYQPTTQTNPRQALSLFGAQPDGFDLVITDLTMPGMTGVDLAKAMLAVRPRLPVLLASGFNGSYSLEMIHDLGIRDLVPKPIDLTQLSQAVHQALCQEDKPSPGVP